jgi:hypothetical protein
MMREAFSLNMKDTGPSFLISWNPQGNLFALGGKGRVHIMDHSGQEIYSFEVITNDYIKYMDWNREGSTLALLQVRYISIPLYLYSYFPFCGLILKKKSRLLFSCLG